MPELPEVETIRRDLTRDISRKTISSVQVIDARVLRQPEKEFARRLKGQGIVSIERRGKALMIKFASGDSLVVQVMMTGQLVFNRTKGTHTRVVFKFTDGTTLAYNDQRVFGQLRVVKDLGEIKHFRIIGPEPFDASFSNDYVATRFKSSKRPIKNILLDHTFVAGIGNIYACEILFRCGITPKRLGSKIKSAEIPVLRKQISDVLKEAILHRGSSMRNYRDGAGEQGKFKARIKVYARENGPCVVCASSIKRIIQAGRSTFYCMKCQK